MDRLPGDTPRTSRARGNARRLEAPTTPANVIAQSVNTARAMFIDAARRDTPGSDLPRYVAVLDAILAWTAARADQLVFSSSGPRPGLIRFERAGTKALLWSARTTRGGPPTFEIHVVSSEVSGTRRAEAMRTLNAYSRDPFADSDRLRIGFGALKNAGALAAILALLDRLLLDTSLSADACA